jgi:hypothetical protein
MAVSKTPSPKKLADEARRLAKLLARIEKNLKAREVKTGKGKL